jgi:DNA-binding NarL/FixJ family response regulator
MIRVIVADDHHLIRAGIRSLLERADDIKVVGEAGDGKEAIKLVRQYNPDVAVMDIAMPLMNGIRATERICALGVATQVIILSMYSDDTLVYQALRNGARGYLLKYSVTEELLLAVRSASRGETYLSPAITGSILANYLAFQGDRGKVAPFDQLTPREREVCQLIAEGKTNNEAAKIMEITERTVEKHRANLMSKLGIHDLAGLVRIAIKYGLVALDE